MPLTCSCNWDPEPGDECWEDPEDYETLQTKRRQRCCSCNVLIDVGSIVAKTRRYRIPSGDIECAIYGEGGEIGLADKFLCEGCADLFFSLKELGFCNWAGENQKELVAEYAEMQKESSKYGG